VLVGELGAAAVVVGENFRFGYKAAGDVGDLVGSCASTGATPTRSRCMGERRASAPRASGHFSSRARWPKRGAPGRPYAVRGEVVLGDRRGRTIGFPTANVRPDPAVVVPARGVYACAVHVGEDVYAACTNVGVAPTFERGESRIEAHLLDFGGGLYGRIVEVRFLQWIRGERRFSGVDELKEQIGRDVEEARRLTGVTRDPASEGRGWH
jgi:riboflavin kinase/FMN adenylyltransferase